MFNRGNIYSIYLKAVIHTLLGRLALASIFATIVFAISSFDLKPMSANSWTRRARRRLKTKINILGQSKFFLKRDNVVGFLVV